MRSAALAVALSALLAAPAFASGTVSASLQGPSIYDDGTVYKSGAEVVDIGSSGQASGRSWGGRARAAKSEATDELSVFAGIWGTSTAHARAEARSTSIPYVLRPPEGARFDSGKLVVYGAIADADIRGNASLRFVLDVEAKFANGETRVKFADRTLKERPGEESVEFFVAMPLPAALDSTRAIDLLLSTAFEAASHIEADAGGKQQEAWVSAEDAGPLLAGFEVLDSAGKQVRGFTMTAASGLVVPERAPPKAGIARAVEFYHPDQQNFFVTANDEEIAMLDSGAIDGWLRTGLSFNVYVQGGAGTTGICRFYADKFAPDFAHVYVAAGTECDALLKNPVWKFEGIAFHMPLPGPDGACPAGHRPVYRLYNNGMDGAPSHRLTTRMLTRLEMIGDVWSPEGYGPGVAMCSPM